jgi:hypothetical protein
MLKRIIDATRRNHALEHGTVSIMLGRTGPNLRLVGRAVSDGFYIYGRVPTDLLAECAEEALSRFHRGEGSLAVTPLCGTNIAVAGLLAGALSTMAMGGERRLERLPSVFSAAMLGIVISQPAGRWVQRYVTTRPDLANIRIVGIRRGLGGRVHKVQTTTIEDEPASPNGAAILDLPAPVAQWDRAPDF